MVIHFFFTASKHLFTKCANFNESRWCHHKWVSGSLSGHMNRFPKVTEACLNPFILLLAALKNLSMIGLSKLFKTMGIESENTSGFQ